MAGIYIHIPFCKQRCNYCDFYKTTQVLKKPEFIDALLIEIQQRKFWLKGEAVKTIYFGGGTPSLLSTDELKRIFDTITENYSVERDAEITLESNPDDLTLPFIQNLKNTPVNRLSIGIQSFQDTMLETMNRRHNSHQAIACVKHAQDAGFNNISTDLIYGLPNLTMQIWEHNLEQMRQLNIQHLSAYHLTYEEGTVFDTMLKKGALKPITEETSIKQFKTLLNWAKNNDFDHYEISNFAKSGFYSKHNTSYWQQEKYLGLGPSAHSYNVDTRSWNVANLGNYLNAIQKNEKYYDSEVLTELDKYNEFLMTGLRTKWGVNRNKISDLFGVDFRMNFEKAIKPFVDKGSLYVKNENVLLTDEGIFISDLILSDLILVSEK